MATTFDARFCPQTENVSFNMPRPPVQSHRDYMQTARGLLKSSQCVNSKIKPINLVSLLGKFFAAPSMKKSLKTFIKILELYEIYWTFSFTGSYTVIKMLVTGIKHLPHLVADGKSLFSNIIGGNDTMPQSGFVDIIKGLCQNLGSDIPPDTGNALALLLSIAVPIVAVVGCMAGCFTTIGAKIAKAIALAGQCLKGSETCFSSFGSLKDKVQDIVYNTFGLGSPSAKTEAQLKKEEEDALRQNFIDKIDSTVDSIDQFHIMIKEDAASFLRLPDAVSQLTQKVLDASALLAESAHHKFVTSQCRYQLDTLRAKRDAIKKIYEDLLSSVKGKQIPVTLWLYGSSGVGKSCMSTGLIDYLSYLEGRPLTHYSRNPSLAHWDGYAGQDVVVYDDFGQDVQNTDHLELQQIYTPNEYIVPQAGVDAKGRRFTSKYLLICSNFPLITSSKRMTDVTVNHRRRDLFFRVNDAFIENRAQHTPQEIKDHYKADFSHLVFTPLNPIPDGNGTIQNLNIPPPSIYDIAKNMYDICQDRCEVFDAQVKSSVANFLCGEPPLTGDQLDARAELKGERARFKNPLKFAIKPKRIQVQRDDYDILVDELFAEAHVPRPPPGVETISLPITRSDPDDDPDMRRIANLNRIREHRVKKGKTPFTDHELQATDDSYCVVCFAADSHTNCPKCTLRICQTCSTKDTCCQLLKINHPDLQPNPADILHQLIPDAVGQAITVQSITRNPIVLLMGAPGTGKSTVSRLAHADFDIRDEFPLTDAGFLQTVNDVFHRYDNAGAPLLLTCNRATLLGQFAKHFPGDDDKSTAFLRRCDIFEFTFRRNWLYQLKTVANLRSEKHHEVVKIVYQKDNAYVRDVEISFVRNHIVTINSVVETLDFVSSLEKCAFPSKPDIHVKLSITSEGLRAEGRRFKFSDFQFVCGYTRIIEFMNIFSKLVVREFATVEDAIFAIQEEKIIASANLIGVLECPEGCFVAEAIKGQIVVMKRVGTEDIPSTADGESYEEAQEQAAAIVQVAENLDKLFLFFDYVVHLGLTGLGLWVNVDDIQEELRDKRRRHLCRFVIPEANWADEVEEADEDQFVDADHSFQNDPDSYRRYCELMSQKVPKSARQPRKTGTEYCPQHHTCGCPCVVPTPVQPQRQKQRFHAAYQCDAKPLKKEAVVVASKIESQSGTLAEIESRRKLQPRVTCIVEDSKTDAIVQPESINDPQALAVSMLCCHNSVDVISSAGVFVCRALMVRDRVGVTVAHIVESDAKFNFMIRTATGATFDAKILRQESGRDLVFFELPNTAQQFRDITKHFQSRETVKDFSGYKALLNVVTRSNQTTVNCQRPMLLAKNSRYKLEGVEQYGYTYSGHLDSYDCTSVTTTFGDCGSGLVLLNPTSTEKILGIHSAASMTSSFAAPIYKEDFNRAIGQSVDITFNKCNWVKPTEEDKEYCGFPVIGYAEHEGVRIKQNCPTSTELWTSPFKSIVPEEFEPCLLSMHDKRNPGHDFLHEGPKKWNHKQPEVDLDLLEHCVDEFANYFSHKIHSANLKNSVLTKTEAINGVSYLPGSNPIYRQSSAGYPFKHLPGVKQKTTFFHQGENLLFSIHDNQQGRFLNDAVDRLIDTARRSRPGNIFCVSLKDEPRKLPKIYDTPATRTFAACSLDYTIAQRMYFHTAAASITTIHNEVPCKIGIDSKSLEWENLYYYHSRVSEMGFDMDFKDWDATVPLVFMQSLPEIYNRIYQLNDPNWKPEDDVIRRNIHSVVHGPLLLIDDVVVQAPGGQVSGQPLTALDNCFVNCLYSYYIWCKLAPKHLANFISYKKNVVISVYGDDNITTVAPQCLEFFNFKTYAEECRKLNLNVTAADKTDNAAPFKQLWELSFLKQNFTKVSGHIIGKPEKSSIHKMLSFCHNPKNHYWDKDRTVVRFKSDSIGGVIRDALVFAAPHGKEYFETIKTGLTRCARQYSIQCEDWPTYDSIIKDVYLGGAAPSNF